MAPYPGICVEKIHKAIWLQLGELALSPVANQSQASYPLPVIQSSVVYRAQSAFYPPGGSKGTHKSPAAHHSCGTLTVYTGKPQGPGPQVCLYSGDLRDAIL